MKLKNLRKIIVNAPLQALSKLKPINRWLLSASRRYIDIYRGYSYNFEKNGEKQLIKRTATLFEHPIVFFDVGANVGDWTNEAIRGFESYQGHLFEMTKETHANLQNRFQANQHLQINNVALSDTKQEITFKNYGENHGANTLVLSAEFHHRPHSIERVQANRGDDYCKEHDVARINVLKIDVEGAEMAVLNGFDRLLQEKAVDLIQFEYGYTHADAHTLMGDFFAYLNKFGYEVGPLRRSGVHFKKFSYTDNEFKSGPNYIAALPQYVSALNRF